MVDGFSCSLNFPGEDSPYKGNTSIKTLRIFFHQQQHQPKAKKKKKKKERAGKPFPIKTIYKKFIFRLYRNWKKGGGR